MTTEKYEKEMREQRLIEATKKGLTGRNGKFSVILKTLGEAIMYHSKGGLFLDVTYMDDPYELEESIETARTHEEIRDRIPMELEGDPGMAALPGGTDELDPSSPEWRANPDIQQAGVGVIGWNFDGLSRGMHLEIRYMLENNELLCQYKGYEVYKEVRGELLGYAPMDEWEGWVDKLYKIARQKHGQLEIFKTLKNEKEAERKKQNWLERFKLRWGL